MTFKRKKYLVIRNVIPRNMANFIYGYFMIRRKVAKKLLAERYISPFEDTWGTWTDKQVPNTYSHYGDGVMETLLERVKPRMEKETKLKLVPTYSYARIYKKGDKLKRHKDRFSCEISTTLHLGGDPWSIFIDPTGGDFVIDELKEIHRPNAPKGIKIDLKPGDMLIYKGLELEHWREPFQGTNCCQVFLHYNQINSPGAIENRFDRRPFLGLPSWFKK